MMFLEMVMMTERELLDEIRSMSEVWIDMAKRIRNEIGDDTDRAAAHLRGWANGLSFAAIEIRKVLNGDDGQDAF